jgi:hypothetical protein
VRAAAPEAGAALATIELVSLRTTTLGMTLAAALAVGGCASATCAERPRGWLSGWGSGGGGAFTVGLGRAWGDCDGRPRRAAPPPSADPASEPPLGSGAPR